MRKNLVLSSTTINGVTMQTDQHFADFRTKCVKLITAVNRFGKEVNALLTGGNGSETITEMLNAYCRMYDRCTSGGNLNGYAIAEGGRYTSINAAYIDGVWELSVSVRIDTAPATTEEAHDNTGHNPFAQLTREERREVKAGIRARFAVLVNARKHTTHPAETIAELVSTFGYDETRKIIALLVNASSSSDGRISPSSRKFAASVAPYNHDELWNEMGIYAPADIHPAHIDNLVTALSELDPCTVYPRQTEELEELEQLMNDEYCKMYAAGEIPRNNIFVFARSMERNPDFNALVRRFAAHRGDFISSDREAAAFVRAWIMYGELHKKRA